VSEKELTIVRGGGVKGCFVDAYAPCPIATPIANCFRTECDTETIKVKKNGKIVEVSKAICQYAGYDTQTRSRFHQAKNLPKDGWMKDRKATIDQPVYCWQRVNCSGACNFSKKDEAFMCKKYNTLPSQPQYETFPDANSGVCKIKTVGS
jgi:hypothetical protein